MADYISRGVAISEILSEPTDAHYPSWYAEKLKQIPTADVVEVRHGEWEQDEQDKWRCSVCQAGNHYAYAWDVKTRDYTKLQDNYCPNCGCATLFAPVRKRGADMRKVVEIDQVKEECK